MSLVLDDNGLLISGIQHFVFCRRQWALIYIEQAWDENYYTTSGKIMHEAAHDDTFIEKRKDTLVTRGMSIHSDRFHIRGKCDVVEFIADPSGVVLEGREGLWRLYPVEYKRGKPKEHQADELQLCAEAVCLEEMFCCSIPEAYLYYGEIRRRVPVSLTEELRATLEATCQEMREDYARGYTPRVRVKQGCRTCSLRDQCLPELENAESTNHYLDRVLTEDQG